MFRVELQIQVHKTLGHFLAGVPAAGDHPEPVHRVRPRGPGARWLGRHRPAEDQQGAGEAAGVGWRVGLLRFAQQHRSRERLRGQSQRLPTGRGASGGPAAAERLQRRQVPLASCQSEQHRCLALNSAQGQSKSHCAKLVTCFQRSNQRSAPAALELHAPLVGLCSGSLERWNTTNTTKFLCQAGGGAVVGRRRIYRTLWRQQRSNTQLNLCFELLTYCERWHGGTAMSITGCLQQNTLLSLLLNNTCKWRQDKRAAKNLPSWRDSGFYLVVVVRVGATG